MEGTNETKLIYITQNPYAVLGSVNFSFLVLNYKIGNKSILFIFIWVPSLIGIDMWLHNLGAESLNHLVFFHAMKSREKKKTATV